MSERDDVQRWRDPAWWRGWNRLTVSEGPLAPPLDIPGDTAMRALSELREEGWAQLPRPSQDDWVERLREGVLALRERKLPAIFVWAFDEAWMLFGRLDAFWVGILGKPYRSLPCFWAWYIPVGAQQAGWPPHRDRSKGPPSVSANGQPHSLTAWIPLGHATPANSCMYLVPAPFSAPDRTSLRMQDARALPAEPGEVLVWRQDVWHWGGRSSSQASEPRISLSLELQAGADIRYHGPLLDPRRPPPLDHRLALIGANILRYRGFVKNRKLAALGRALLETAPELDHSVASELAARPLDLPLTGRSAATMLRDGG